MTFQVNGSNGNSYINQACSTSNGQSVYCPSYTGNGLTQDVFQNSAQPSKKKGFWGSLKDKLFSADNRCIGGFIALGCGALMLGAGCTIAGPICLALGGLAFATGVYDKIKEPKALN